MISFLKKPSAWVPLAMSLSTLALVLGYIAIFGVDQEPKGDEGAAARIFQLLLAGQVPIIAFFGIRWLPQMPKQALGVLGLQFMAALAAFALVFFLEL
jgi:hypothetical protein